MFGVQRYPMARHAPLELVACLQFAKAVNVLEKQQVQSAR